MSGLDYTFWTLRRVALLGSYWIRVFFLFNFESMFSSYIPLSLEFSSPFLTVLSHLLLQWVEEPTLLVTRFEYANLFHTITDWYSAYVSSRVTNLPNRPNVIFVDGHCKVCDALCILLLVQFILFVAWVMTNKSVSSATTVVNNISHIFVCLILVCIVQW
jgi:prepilin-type processing-associated H-X9-DG protein